MSVDFRNYNTKRKPEFRMKNTLTRKYYRNTETIYGRILFWAQKKEEENLQTHAKSRELGTNNLKLGISSNYFPIFGHFV